MYKNWGGYPTYEQMYKLEKIDFTNMASEAWQNANTLYKQSHPDKGT